MKIREINGQINWENVAQIVREESICLKFGNYQLVINKTQNFLEKIQLTIKYLLKFAPSNWFIFVYNSDFSSIDSVISNIDILNNYPSDITLLGSKGEILDTLDYIHLRHFSSMDNANIYNIIKTDTHSMYLSQLHSMNLTVAGEKAKSYLKHTVNGKYLFDVSSNIIPGVAFTFKDGEVTNQSYGYGRAFHFHDAFNIAALEAVERFTSQFYSYNYKDSTLYASYNELKDLAYEPAEFILEEDSKVNNNSKLYWTKSQSLVNGHYIWIPEDLAVYGNSIYRKGYMRNIHDSSNGVSLAGSYSEAVLGALLELIERHSFLVTWFGEIPGHKIKLSQCNISKELAYAVNRLKRQGYQIDLFEISVISPVYVVWCLIRNNHSNAKMFSYSAAGSGLVLSDAVSAALKEAVVGMSIYANEQEEMPKVPKNIVTLEDHVRFYGNIANKNAFNFTNQFTNFVDDNRYLNLGSQNTSITKSEVINFIIEKLKKEFKDILIVNLTSDYLKKHDLYTVKAVIPGMFPMTFGDNSLRIDIDYINKLRTNLGLFPLDKLEKIPHPFP